MGVLQTIVPASFRFGLAAMFGTVMLCVLASIRCAPEDVPSNVLGATVNSIALVHYAQMARSNRQGEPVYGIRFSDWAATVPLMVVELHALMKVDLVTAIPGAISAFLMILTGAMAYPFAYTPFKITMVLVSFVLLAAAILSGVLHMGESEEANAIAVAFVAPWPAYGIVFLVGGSDLAYNALDVICKCGLAAVVALRSV